MPKLTFVTQSAWEPDNPEGSGSRLLNCYAESATQDARTRLNIRTVLGQAATTPTEVTSSGTVRAVESFAGSDLGDFFVVQNGALWGVSPAASGGTSTNLGTITDNYQTSISRNGADITVVGGTTYYCYDDSGSTMLTPGSGVFAQAGSVSYLDGYTILTENGGQRFEWTELADPTTRNALHFATANGRPDDLRRGMADHSHLWLFGDASIEIWYNTGGAGANAFARLPNAVIDIGLKAFLLATRIDRQIMFMGTDDKIYLTDGTNIRPISTPAIEEILSDFTPSHLFTYEDRGNKFGVARFGGRVALVYDLVTGLWHERATGAFSAWEQAFSAFSSPDTVVDRGEWYGIATDGSMWQMSDTYTDLNNALSRRMVSAVFHQDGRKFSVSELEFLCGMGRDSDADVVLRVSGNGGNTWSTVDTLSLGEATAYANRVKFYALGSYQEFSAEFTVDEAANIPLFSDANMQIS